MDVIRPQCTTESTSDHAVSQSTHLMHFSILFLFTLKLFLANFNFTGNTGEINPKLILNPGNKKWKSKKHFPAHCLLLATAPHPDCATPEDSNKLNKYNINLLERLKVILQLQKSDFQVRGSLPQERSVNKILMMLISCMKV